MPTNESVSEKLRGTIERVYYAGPKFSAGCLQTESGMVQFAGNLFATEKQPVVLMGIWSTHPKYGRQFKVEFMEHDMDLNAEGLIKYLANHPDFKGIGPAKARVIVEMFGDDFEHALNEMPDSIAKAVNIPIETVERLRDKWMKNRSANKLMAKLSQFDLTYNQVDTLVNALGHNCLNVLNENPYVLIDVLKGFGFKRVDNIARKMGTPKSHPGRIKAGIQYCVNDALNQGHCWIEHDDLIEQANTLLVMDDLDSKARIESVIDELLDKEELDSESDSGRLLIALPHILERERKLAAIFKIAGKPNPHFNDMEDFESLIIKRISSLNDKQMDAVHTALTHSISFIGGGAGSGKSYTVSAINTICNSLDLDVVLAAPTGKAAKRLEEVCHCSAVTIHRLLEYNGEFFARCSTNPIHTDILIVDEFSMVDINLAWHLFEAVRLDTTVVVIVGDHNQLPPIGPGNVLRDLINTRAIPMIILDKVVRQAGALKESCTAILNGEVRKTSDLSEANRSAWYKIDHLTDAEDLRDHVLELFKGELQTFGFNVMRDVQVLTPTHKGLLGTRAMNESLQKLVQKHLWDVDVPETAPNRRLPFLKHDKVIQTRNNYDLKVMNGTIGQIKEVLLNGSLLIDFDGTIVEIRRDSKNMQDIQLAYALTFHKCVAGDTLISTGNGLVPIESLMAESDSGETSSCLLSVSTHRGLGSAVNISDEGIKDCIELTTQHGFRLKAALGHKVYTRKNGTFHWASIESLSIGDKVMMRRGTMADHDEIPYQQIALNKETLVVDEDIGWLFGALDGDDAQCMLKDHLINTIEGTYDLFEKAGLHLSKDNERKMPWAILQSPVSVQLAYLRGLFDACGFVNDSGVHFVITGKRMAEDVQQVLFANGILAYRKPMSLSEPNRQCIAITDKAEIEQYDRLIGFNSRLSTRKNKQTNKIRDNEFTFERITHTKKLQAHVYDFLVPGAHSYIGNGFINHNCQGSEFPCAIVIVHRTHSFMHHQNLFYTGVTRAKHMAIVVGDRWGMRDCAMKTKVDKRRTFLSFFLANNTTEFESEYIIERIGYDSANR